MINRKNCTICLLGEKYNLARSGNSCSLEQSLSQLRQLFEQETPHIIIRPKQAQTREAELTSESVLQALELLPPQNLVEIYLGTQSTEYPLYAGEACSGCIGQGMQLNTMIIVSSKSHQDAQKQSTKDGPKVVLENKEDKPKEEPDHIEAQEVIEKAVEEVSIAATREQITPQNCSSNTLRKSILSTMVIIVLIIVVIMIYFTIRILNNLRVSQLIASRNK